MTQFLAFTAFAAPVKVAGADVTAPAVAVAASDVAVTSEATGASVVPFDPLAPAPAPAPAPALALAPAPAPAESIEAGGVQDVEEPWETCADANVAVMLALVGLRDSTAADDRLAGTEQDVELPAGALAAAAEAEAETEAEA